MSFQTENEIFVCRRAIERCVRAFIILILKHNKQKGEMSHSDSLEKWAGIRTDSCINLISWTFMKLIQEKL